MSGKKNAKIPWGMLAAKPSSWIESECSPVKFPWEDPSHIKKEQVLKLLAHWEKRRNDNLEPLIWAPSCPLLKGAENLSAHKGCLPWCKGRNSRLSDDENDESFEFPSDSGGSGGHNAPADDRANSESNYGAAISSDNPNEFSGGAKSDEGGCGTEDHGESDDYHMNSPPPHADMFSDEWHGMVVWLNIRTSENLHQILT